MPNNLWRYSIEGEAGGLVIANTKEEAEEKVVKYHNHNSHNHDNWISLLVWKLTDDDFYDESNPDVFNCY